MTKISGSLLLQNRPRSCGSSFHFIPPIAGRIAVDPSPCSSIVPLPSTFRCGKPTVNVDHFLNGFPHGFSRSKWLRTHAIAEHLVHRLKHVAHRGFRFSWPRCWLYQQDGDFTGHRELSLWIFRLRGTRSIQMVDLSNKSGNGTEKEVPLRARETCREWSNITIEVINRF